MKNTLTSTLALVLLCAAGTATAATATSHRTFRGENLSATFTFTQPFLCADGSVRTQMNYIYLSPFTQITRNDGSAETIDLLQVAVFGINPCLNEYYLGSAMVEKPDYNQSNVNRAVLRGTIAITPVYGEGGSGTLALDLVFNGTGPVFPTKLHFVETYPGLRTVFSYRGTSRAATVAGTVMFNTELATVFDSPFLNFTRSGIQEVIREVP
jgi:hypothetical protein